MAYRTIENAKRDMNNMNSIFDKKLFISLYGDLINEKFKTRLKKEGNVDTIFKELCEDLKRKKQE